jgi:hypothetical protein
MAAETQLANWQNAVDNRLDFGKAAYLEAAPDLANANAASEGVAKLQGGVAGIQGKLSSDLAGRVDKFSDLQDQYSGDAFGYNSADRQAQVSGKAMADVASQFDNTQQQSQRQLSRMGVNPSSGRQLALTNQLGIAKASASAGAASKARQDLESVANERQKTAIGFGANLPSQSAQAAQMAASAGNSAVNSATAPLTNRLAFAGGVSNIYGDSAAGNADMWRAQNLTASQAAALSADAQARADANDSNWLSAVGSIAGSKAGGDLISSGVKAISSWFS